MTHLVLSAAGRFAAVRTPRTVDIVDLMGTSPRRAFPLVAGDYTIAGTTLCLLDDAGLRLEPLEGERRGTIVEAAPELARFWGRRADAVLCGDAVMTLAGSIERRVDRAQRWFPLMGRTLLGARAGQLTIATPGRPDVKVPFASGEVVAVAPLFNGRSIALIVRGSEAREVIVLTASGQLVHRLALPALHAHTFAIERGQLLVATGGSEIVAFDLRYGRQVGTGTLPHDVLELAADEDGRSVAVAGPGASEPVVSVMRIDELLQARTTIEVVELPEEERDDSASEPAIIAEPVVIPPVAAPAPAVPDTIPLALGRPPRAPQILVDVDAAAFADPGEHLAALLDLIAAHGALAIANAWHAGRISADSANSLPHEREVLALAGSGSDLAPGRVLEARTRVVERAVKLRDRVFASIAIDVQLPFVELATELGLSPLATQILAAVLAPKARGEIARIYAILTDGDDRCTETVLAQLLADDDYRVRDAIHAELEADAPLVRHGIILRDARGHLDVDDALIARLRGRPAPCSPGVTLRSADRALADLAIDRDVVTTLVRELADPRDQVRVVVRGRRGSGRHALIAALADRVGRKLMCIDANELPRGVGRAKALERELTRATIAGAIPIVSGLEVREGVEGDEAQLIRQLLRSYAGPLVLRTAPDAHVMLEPGFVDVTLPALSETERARVFQRALADAGLTADAPELARRYRIGPGTIMRVVTDAKGRMRRSTTDATKVVDEVARQHVVARIGSAAQRVTRLATWDQVALPEDMLDSLRELIGRARHSRKVFDDWGYDQRISTARGLTALFYGPPGTGKTMVAGLIARELGLDMYRVDLSKVLSKWVGETEKNLAEIFDAAEDGRLLLLFDEADSLFAKRSEVKSSNDRYANIEVNYLLQRLDAFEGVAIMTTNLEGSIDPAFKRRLSMRLYFPFPDEDMRERLWEAHVMPQIPVAGRLDFAALARRFPLSGGYIRNSTLRAAFLAAQERTSLTQSHLERAVLLEYRELGKLASDGRME